MIKNAVAYFSEFHKGAVNQIVHVVGFAGVFYSIYGRNVLLFSVSVVALESGHIYNHVAGIKKYDFRPRIIFSRLVVFGALCIAFFWLAQFFKL